MISSARFERHIVSRTNGSEKCFENEPFQIVTCSKNSVEPILPRLYQAKLIASVHQTCLD